MFGCSFEAGAANHGAGADYKYDKGNRKRRDSIHGVSSNLGDFDRQSGYFLSQSHCNPAIGPRFRDNGCHEPITSNLRECF